jgi:ferrous iron transport protein A
VINIAPKFVTIYLNSPLVLLVMDNMKKLNELKVGELGTINSFDEDEIFIKLMEMGCVPGELVKVEQIAPLGDPISIAVAGYILSLRLDEASKIWIVPAN